MTSLYSRLLRCMRFHAPVLWPALGWLAAVGVGSVLASPAFAETNTVSTDATIQKMLDRIGGESLVGTIEQQVGASIGVARYPGDGSDAHAMLLHADIAMYEAKNRGRSQAFAFNSGLAEQTSGVRSLNPR